MDQQQTIKERREKIQLLTVYAVGEKLYLLTDINEYDEDPGKWQVSLMRFDNRSFHVRSLEVFIKMIDSNVIQPAKIKLDKTEFSGEK